MSIKYALDTLTTQETTSQGTETATLLMSTEAPIMTPNNTSFYRNHGVIPVPVVAQELQCTRGPNVDPHLPNLKDPHAESWQLHCSKALDMTFIHLDISHNSLSCRLLCCMFSWDSACCMCTCLHGVQICLFPSKSSSTTARTFARLRCIATVRPSSSTMTLRVHYLPSLDL